MWDASFALYISVAVGMAIRHSPLPSDIFDKDFFSNLGINSEFDDFDNPEDEEDFEDDDEDLY